MKGLYRGFHRNENGTETIVLNGEKIKGEWVQGSLIELDEVSGYVYICKPYLLASSLTPFDLIKFNSKLVIPETICEAVRGLTDRNGKQVFENDIIEREITYFNNSSISFYVIGYNDFGMAYNDFPSKDDYWRGLNDNENGVWRMQSKTDNFAVIGTIFDEQFAEGEK